MARASQSRSGLRRRAQEGMVIIVVVALVLLAGALFAFSSLNVAAVRVDRDSATNEALAKAKDALIAYAVSDSARPGQLPCPDVNDDGEAKSGDDYVAGTGACNSLIGKLPWKTLGLPDLRDDSGERLWYVVSADFRASNALALNSDTADRAGNQSLTLQGITPASNLVALVVSPGGALQRADGHKQTRGCTACNAIDFLDLAAGEDNADANRIFVSAPRGDTFNDRLLPVFSDDIMRIVERRAARELAQQLRNHYDAWAGSPLVVNTKGFYPYAAALNDPSVAGVGTNGIPAGMLPLSTAPLTWSGFPAGCWTENAGTVLRCNTLVVCVLVCVPASISARIDNVATRFADPPQAADFQFLGVNLGGGATWTLNTAARRLEFTYSGIVAAGVLDIQVMAPRPSGWLTTSWLTANNWHQNAGYALSPGYAIDGVGSCGGAGPSCITIMNTSAPTNNKHAVVLMSGRTLPSAGQTTRPVSVPANANQFFEGQNPDATYTVLEANARTATFNDTPVAVRP